MRRSPSPSSDSGVITHQPEFFIFFFKMPVNKVLTLLNFFSYYLSQSRFRAWAGVISSTFNKAAPKSSPFLPNLAPDSAKSLSLPGPLM